MDYHSIEELIRRFWLGETSLEEENTLKEYFLYNQNPPQAFQVAADYFAEGMLRKRFGHISWLRALLCWWALRS